MDRWGKLVKNSLAVALAAGFFSLLVLTSSNAAAVDKNLPPVRLAVVNTFGNHFSGRYFNGTIEKIANSVSPRPLKVQFYDPDSYLEAAKNKEFDLSIASSGITAVRINKYGGTPLLTSVQARTPNPNRSNGAVMITRGDRSDINSIKDFQGKSLGIMSKNAFAGFSVPMAQLEREGINPNTLFSKVVETHSSMDKLVQMVKNGDVDVAFVVTCLLENLELVGEIKPGEIKVIDEKPNEDFYCRRSTELYPGWIFSASSNLKASTLRKLVEVLLEMPESDDGMGTYWTIANDYQAMNELVKRMETRYLDQRDWHWIYEQYKVYFIAAGLILLGLVLNWLYLAIAIRMRTAALKRQVAENLAIEKENQQIHERIESLQRVQVIGLLSGMVAHELKQPLAVINNYVEGLRRRLGKGEKFDSEVLSKILSQIQTEGVRAADIVDFVRGYSKKVRRERKVFDLGGFAYSLFQLLVRMQYLPKRNSFVSDEHVFIEADRLGVELILINLLRNAADACKKVKSPKVSVSIRKLSDDAEIQVEDNGPVLSDTDYQRMLKTGESSKKDGLGMGLAIVRQLLEANAGSLKFVRKPEGGIICVVKLPLAKENSHEA